MLQGSVGVVLEEKVIRDPLKIKIYPRVARFQGSKTHIFAKKSFFPLFLGHPVCMYIKILIGRNHGFLLSFTGRIFSKMATHPLILGVSRQLLGDHCRLSSFAANTVLPGIFHLHHSYSRKTDIFSSIRENCAFHNLIFS